MDLSKPIVQVACVCDSVLFDKGDVPSVIRIVDEFTCEIPDNVPLNVPIGFPARIFVRLKFLDLNSNGGTVALQAMRPDGTMGTRQNSPFEKGSHENIQVLTEFHVLNPQQGTYKFDVFWNDEQLTTIPIKVVVKRLPAPGAARQT